MFAQDGLGEPTRLAPGELHGERLNDDVIDTDRVQTGDAVFERLNPRYVVVWPQDVAWRGIEGQHHRGCPHGAGLLQRGAEQVLVAQMHPIEVADGQDRTRSIGRYVVGSMGHEGGHGRSGVWFQPIQKNGPR